MPCIVEETSDERNERHYMESKLPMAVLCAVFRHMENSGFSVRETIEDLDLAEAGVPVEDVMRWWGEHKFRDSLRKDEEHKRKARYKELLSKSTASMTPEELIELATMKGTMQ